MNYVKPGLPEELLEKIWHSMHPLTAWRKVKGLTQAELAKLAGCRVATIGDWERGKTVPLFDTVVVIAEALRVKVDELARRGTP